MVMNPASVAPARNAARGLALVSLVGVGLYVAVDALLFFLRPDLSLISHAESDYGNGPWAWVMDGNFLLRCALSLAAVGALWYALPRSARARIALGLLTVWAIGSGLLAFFADDPEGTRRTAHGAAHLFIALVAFVCCLLATLLLTLELNRLWPGRPAVRALLAIWVIATLGLALLTLTGLRAGAPGGLYERVFLGFELLWIAVVMWLLYMRRLAHMPKKV
jgi:hypothetical protein